MTPTTPPLTPKRPLYPPKRHRSGASSRSSTALLGVSGRSGWPISAWTAPKPRPQTPKGVVWAAWDATDNAFDGDGGAPEHTRAPSVSSCARRHRRGIGKYGIEHCESMHVQRAQCIRPTHVLRWKTWMSIVRSHARNVCAYAITRRIWMRTRRSSPCTVETSRCTTRAHDVSRDARRDHVRVRCVRGVSSHVHR